MADKGKAMMSEEEMKREWEEEMERKRVQELVDQWMSYRPDIRPPIPGDFEARPVSYIRSPEARRPIAFPSYPPGFPPLPKHQQAEPSSQTPPASPEYTPASPEYTPASPLPDLPVVTDWVTEDDLDFFWERRKAPEFPNTGPWFRFDMGYIRFRYGASWAQIDQKEREAARARRNALARGEKVLQKPPPKQPGEVIIRIVELLPAPPAPASPALAPPAPAPPAQDGDSSDDDDDLMDDGDNSSSESEGEGENPAPQDWSDTSTITEESTQVPFNLRRFLSLRRRGRGRG